MKKIIPLILLVVLISGCSTFINLVDDDCISNMQKEAKQDNDNSSNEDKSKEKLEEIAETDETESGQNQELYDYLTTIDSLYQELDEKESFIDSLMLEMSRFKDNIIITDVGFPKEMEFAGQTIDLTIERNLERFEKAYNSELKSAANFMPRSGRYFTLMDSIFTQAGVPTDTKYLAIAESRLSYRAHSHMGADGIWQIMPNTGKNYKLQINDYIDQRRDVFKSTEVAANLLNDSYHYFAKKGVEDWLLSYCAYNAGIGNVNKVLQAQGGTQFTDLIFKTQETNDFVWKAIAIKYIFENEEKIFDQCFGREPDILQETKAVQVTLKGHYKIDEWAKAQGTNIGSVYELNPWIKIYSQSRQKYSAINEVILPAGTHNVLIPIESIPDSVKVAELEEQFLHKNAGYFTHHVVKKGESIFDIARKYKTTANHIKQLNGLNSNLVKPGQKLKLSGNAGTGGKGMYTVQEGDSICGISSKLKIKQQTLIAKNNLAKNNAGIIIIHPGQKLAY